jgi:hypothetical protein
MVLRITGVWSKSGNLSKLHSNVLGTVIHFLSSHPVWCVLCRLPVSLFALLEYLRDTPLSFFHELAIIQATRKVFFLYTICEYII